MATSSEAKEHLSKNAPREKRKSMSNLSEDQTPSKRRKDTNDTATKETKKDQVKEQKVDKMDVEVTGEKVAKLDKSDDPSEKQPTRLKQRFTDKCTAFISNLSLDVS